jgi:hypothetical protein
MASSHDQHHGASSAGHEDPETVADARAGDDDGHDAHGHDDGHDAHGHGHDDGHAVERSGWVLIPLGVGVAIAAVIIALFGVQSDPPERTDPIGATQAETGGGHGSSDEAEHASEDEGHGSGTDDGEHEADEEESTPTTHE